LVGVWGQSVFASFSEKEDILEVVKYLKKLSLYSLWINKSKVTKKI
jgi:hypothetical protein